MSTTQLPYPQRIGWNAYAALATGPQALSASGSKLALSFVPESNETLSELSVYCTATTGGGSTATDMYCDIYSDNVVSGFSTPLASLGTSAGLKNVGAGWYRFSGGTLGVALTQGTPYWAVVYGDPLNPGTIYPTVQWIAGIPLQKYGASTTWPPNKYYYNGTAWASFVGGVAGLRIGYASGKYQGAPIQAAALNDWSGINGTVEYGVQFQWPANAKGNVIGANFIPYLWNGTPTGNLVAKLYTAAGSVASNTPTLQRTSIAIPNGWTNKNACFGFQFTSAYAIPGGTWCVLTLADTVSESAGNFFRGYGATWDSDSNSRLLMPVDATFEQVKFDGASWSVITNHVSPVEAILDSTGEFASVGGGGQTMSRGIMTGGRL